MFFLVFFFLFTNKKRAIEMTLVSWLAFFPSRVANILLNPFLPLPVEAGRQSTLSRKAGGKKGMWQSGES